MDKQRDADEEQTIEQMQDQMKRVAFRVGNRLLRQGQATSDYLWYILTIFESLQILWFSIHPTLTFLSSSLGLVEFQTGLRYIGFEYAMRVGQSTWQIFTIISFILVVIHAISLAVTIYLATRPKPNEATEVIAKITNIQILVFNTILVGPLLNVTAVTLYCDPASVYHQNQECYSPTGIGFCVLAALVGIFTLVEALIFNLAYYTKNPLSKSCLAMPGGYGGAAKILLKILPPIYYVVDINSQYTNVYMFSLVVVLLGYLFFFRLFARHNFVDRFFYFGYCCEATIAWFSIINILQYYMTVQGTPNLCFYYTMLGAIPLCYALVRLEEGSKHKIFLEGIRNLKKNKQVADEFLQMLITVMEEAEVPTKRIQLLGFMKIHNASCEKESGCVCHSFLEDFFRRKQLTREEQQLRFNQFLKCLVQDYIKKYPGVILFRLIYAYLLYYRLESRVQAVHCITEAGREKLSFSEELMVYRLKLQFQDDSREKESDLSMDKGHAIRVYLEFNQLFLEFEAEIESCAQDTLEYWCELAEDSPSVLKLWNLARMCELKTARAEKLFTQIGEIYPNNLKTLNLYSSFLRQIALNRKEYAKLHDRIKNEKSSGETSSNRETGSDMKFRENSNLCIITVQTALASMGTIVNSNSELEHILQFGKSEVVGQKLNKLMPKLYYELHDGFITKYIGRPDAEITSREFPVFPLNKKGFLVQAALLVKLIPELEDGFHLAGFIRKIEQPTTEVCHYLMYNQETLTVEEFSESCLALGFSPDAIVKSGNSNPISINYLFPQFRFEDVPLGDLKNDGFETFIDLRIVSENFIENEEEVEENTQNHQQKVKLFLVGEGQHGKLNIKFLKFIVLKQEALAASAMQLTDQWNDGPQPFLTNVRTSERRQSYEEAEKKTEQLAQQGATTDKTDSEQIFQKKFKEFVSHKRSRLLLALLFAGVYIFLVLEIALVSVDLSQNVGNSNEVLAAMGSINDTQNVPMLLGGVVFNARKIEQTYNLSLSSSDFSQYQSDLTLSLTQLQTATVNQIRQEVVLNSSYGYIAPKLFDTFVFFNSGGNLSQDFEYSDAVFELITTGLSISLQKYSSFNVATIAPSIQKDLSFVKSNGLTVFPKLAKYKITNLTTYFDGRFDGYTTTRSILLGLRVASVLIIFLVILPVIVKLDSTNSKLLGLYRQIPISDVVEVQHKCEEFLINHFEEMQARSKAKENIDQQINAQKTTALLKIEEIQEDAVEPSTVKDEEQENLQKKVPKVKLSQIPNSKAQIIFLCCFTIFLLGYCVGEYYLHFYFFMPFQLYEQQVSLLGRVRNSNRYVTMYAQEYMAEKTFNSQLVSDMNIIYEDAELLFSEVPDNSKVREIIYGKMEEIKNLMKAPQQSVMKTAVYKKIQSDLALVQQLLNKQIDGFLTAWRSDVSENFRKIVNIKFAVEFVVVLLLIKILVSGYLDKLKTKTKRSISMVMMIPVGVVMKNETIMAQL